MTDTEKAREVAEAIHSFAPDRLILLSLTCAVLQVIQWAREQERADTLREVLGRVIISGRLSFSLDEILGIITDFAVKGCSTCKGRGVLPSRSTDTGDPMPDQPCPSCAAAKFPVVAALGATETGEDK